MSGSGIYKGVFLCLFFCACAAGTARRIDVPPVPPALPVPMTPETRHAVYVSLQEREAAIQGLRGRFVVRVRSGGGRGLRDGTLVVRRPLDFRFDAVSDLGVLEQQVVSRAGNLTVIWHRDNRYYQGIGTREDLARSLAIDLAAEEAVRFLLAIPALEDETNYRLEAGPNGEIRMKGEKGELAVKEEGGRYLPVEVTGREMDGSRFSQIRYRDYSSEGIPYPHRILGKFSATKVEMSFEEIEVNPSLNGTWFEVEPPADAERVYY